jgi:subtilisin family serine protease
MMIFKQLTLIVASCLILPLTAIAQDFVPGELIIKLRGASSSAKAKQFYGKVAGKISMKASFGATNMHQMSLKPGQDLSTTLEELRQDPDVEFAEPNYILSLIPPDRSDNRSMSMAEAQQTVTASAAGSYTQSYSPVKVTESWGVATASTLITPVVAIVDTGVDYNHTLFTSTGAIWANPGETGTDSKGKNKASNGVDDDGNGYIDDVRGWNFVNFSNAPMDDDEHGTHVAGIVLGVTQDILGTPLAAAKIRIMPLKFLGAGGSGSTSDAIAAIYYAVRNGANVINNSWGGSAYSQALHEALAFAYSNRVTVVAAAGNYASNNDTTAIYPSNYPVPSLIAVSASTDSDNSASFSNFGRNTVHVAAPGVGIMSSVPGSLFKYMSGTSMAAPFVSGMAAMIFREASNLTGYQIKGIITSTINPITSLSTKNSTGGRVNEYNAIVQAKLDASVAASQPVYVAALQAGARAPASEEAKMSGCGLVSTLTAGAAAGASGSGGAAPPPPAAMVVILMLMPLIVWLAVRGHMKAKASAKNRRQYERFVMTSSISVQVGGRELQGQVRTISEGGLSFSADSMLEKGGVITMMITSPDGKEQIQVQGHVVWNEQNGAYGVKFDEAKEGVLSHIRDWTQNLVKAS